MRVSLDGLLERAHSRTANDKHDIQKTLTSPVAVVPSNHVTQYQFVFVVGSFVESLERRHGPIEKYAGPVVVENDIQFGHREQ